MTREQHEHMAARVRDRGFGEMVLQSRTARPAVGEIQGRRDMAETRGGISRPSREGWH